MFDRRFRFIWLVGAIVALAAWWGSSVAFATCGERGGPGYRGPNGKCVGWAQLRSVCGSPPSTNCTPEMVAEGAGPVGPAAASSAATAVGLLSATTIAPVAASAPIAGQATIIDGDTIEIHQQRIRLAGIDAPESDQLCRGDDSLPYRCGAKAANELDRFIAGRPVSCVNIDERTYDRVVAVCTVGGVDLADWMARQGLAFDWPKYSKGDYAAAQREAQQAERGVWSGSFVQPWDYRACKRGGGRPSDCSDDAK